MQLGSKCSGFGAEGFNTRQRRVVGGVVEGLRAVTLGMRQRETVKAPLIHETSVIQDTTNPPAQGELARCSVKLEGKVVSPRRVKRLSLC